MTIYLGRRPYFYMELFESMDPTLTISYYEIYESNISLTNMTDWEVIVDTTNN